MHANPLVSFQKREEMFYNGSTCPPLSEYKHNRCSFLNGLPENVGNLWASNDILVCCRLSSHLNKKLYHLDNVYQWLAPNLSELYLMVLVQSQHPSFHAQQARNPTSCHPSMLLLPDGNPCCIKASLENNFHPSQQSFQTRLTLVYFLVSRTSL